MTRTADTSEDRLERLRAATRANPQSHAFVALAHALCDAGRSAEAEEVCREGLKENPALVSGRVALGRALLDRGRLRDAQEVLVAAAQSDTENADVFLWLGAVVLKRGDAARARALLEHAEELAPHDGRIAERLVAAGGAPLSPSARPRTDFEHTRVGNARALADRMHEQEEPTRLSGPIVLPDEARPRSSAPAPTVAPGADLGIDEPTTIDHNVALRAMTAAMPAAIPKPAPETAPASVPAAAPPPFPRRAPRLSRGRLIALALGAVVLVGAVAGIVALTRRGQAYDEETARDLAQGTLPSLLRARERERKRLAARPSDADALVSLALVNALLAREYGLLADQEAELLLGRLEKLGKLAADRAALVDVTRAYLAMGTGALGEARKAADRAQQAAPELPLVRLSAARVRWLSADAAAARALLEPLLERHPELTLVVAEQARLLIDAGEAGKAAEILRGLVTRTPEHLKGRLLLLDAERALGNRPSLREIEIPCRDQSKRSSSLRAACQLAVAADARSAGDRLPALKSARAAGVEAPDDPRLLASAALFLALLGEVDEATTALTKARRLAVATLEPLLWADVAIQLGQGLNPDPTRLPTHPLGPERWLLTLRAAFAAGGASGLATRLQALPPGYAPGDVDLRAFGLLTRAPADLRGAERTDLERGAERGQAVPSYVLGRLLLDAGDHRLAARRLERALSGHGDACTAAKLFLQAMAAQGRPVHPNHPGLRGLRSRNRGCSLVAP